MNKKYLYLFLISGFIFNSCIKEEDILYVYYRLFINSSKVKAEICTQHIEKANEELSRGNIYYFKQTYSHMIEYKLFKKYGFINYLLLYPYSTDSCFRQVMIEKIEEKLHNKITVLDNEEEELRHLEYSNKKLFGNYSIHKFEDGVYSTDCEEIDYPVMRSPCVCEFREDMVDFIREEYDKDYKSSSFWIVINRNGEVENIEKYQKYSHQVDSVIESELKRTRWVPAINTKDSTFVSSRIVFRIHKRSKSNMFNGDDLVIE